MRKEGSCKCRVRLNVVVNDYFEIHFAEWPANWKSGKSGNSGEFFKFYQKSGKNHHFLRSILANMINFTDMMFLLINFHYRNLGKNG